MYLKSIEIQGFKSFAQKTVLEFHEGVTGIVGPNGSGKSNIADAVRWVLGEQRVKSLRGAAMQDVIFAGTQLRKPQGYAHVAITLDNSDHVLPVDYTEVTVSRRLYRSGESEYRLNGQAVRLKDVQELFYDTGIGKEGYSIIGQGQIDAILNGKPEERRGLFDEAAGIVKFKRRRQIAEKKLEAERADLVRINDILRELERQVEPLRKQSEDAKSYLKLREQQKLYELNAFLRESRESLQLLQEIQEKLRITEEDLAAVRSEGDSLRENYEELDLRLSEMDRQLSDKQEELRKAGLGVSNLENQIALSKAQIEAEKTSAEQLSARLERLRLSQEEKEEQALSCLDSIKALSAQLELVEKGQSEGMESPMAPAGELSGIREKLLAYGKRLEGLLPYSGKELEVALGKAALQDQARREEAEEEEPSWLQEIRSKQSALSGLRERRQRTEVWLKQAEEAQEAALRQEKDLQKSLNDCQQEYHVAATRHDSLRNIAERYEGYGQSIRRVMEARDRVRGVHGVVADLIKTRKEYEVAIETALGGSIQNVVTDSEETAKVLIEYLKKNRLGRATFLPLSAIRPGEKKEYENARREKGVIGLASELTETEETYRKLNEYLLSRTLVADSMESAIAIARKYRHGLRIVTLEGELLSPGGSISGGAYKNSSNLMGRQREIRELAEQMDGILRKVDKLNQRIVEAEAATAERARETEELRGELAELSLEENSLSLGIVSDMKLQYSGLSQKTDFLAETVDRLSRELLSLSGEREELLSGRSAGYERIREKEGEIQSLTESIRHLKEGAERLSSEIQEQQQKKEALSADKKDFFEKREALSERSVSLERERLRIEAQKEKETQRFDSQTEYIWNEYELTASDAQEWYREELGDTAALKKEAAELRKAIRSLGPVNLQALEDYKSVSERYEFLSAQQKDLTASEEAILRIIEDLDQGMKRQFNEKFARIREEFDQVFKLLFGGGQGDLRLMQEEGEDVLSAGIAIIAQPPGKKLQNMMQLSGGEKALTAIALLFAIQNLKPSPFCLLDEIEAALDDSNVSRFARYLHRLTEHTQFILITHRRGTMEAADRLYGVTMQEKGVTALVSVDLVSSQLDQ